MLMASANFGVGEGPPAVQVAQERRPSGIGTACPNVGHP